MYHQRTRDRRGAFTLIELLVVIAIIGVLMALLLPAVQRIRGVGPRTKAVSQINQLSAACAQFKADFGVFPPDNTADVPKVIAAMYPRYTGTYNPGVTSGNALMVHFLGGPQHTGWAIDAPTAPGAGATTKKGPYFDFGATELTSGKELMDPWGQPLKYFASTTGGSYPTAGAYKESSTKFINQGGVQIISAGPNKTFNGGTSLPATGAGTDDLANFNGGMMLGAKQ